MARLGIDVGGTFTDVVVLHEDGRRVVEKVPSTPHDASVGILDGIAQIRRTRGVDVAALDTFSHGSTVATNALLESKLPRTALVVTRGFRDVLEIGTQLRGDLFDLRVAKPRPYVPRSLVFEATERVDRLGEVVTPLTDAEIARLVEEVRAADVEACAITFLFGFRNEEHERRLAAALREAMPELSVAVGCEVAPEIKEYPRACTTVVSAALRPLVARYMSGILSGLEPAGVTCPTFIMQSNGGVMKAEEAAANAHRMVLSGPAAGVLAATQVARQSAYPNQITFDMGGTSTDICLIHEGRARVERESVFEGRPMLVPQFDIHTIGSGGGSLASVDEAGGLRVGPESAGAMPGPACYGRGGTRPTTTDAHLVLGRIDPAAFLGGEMPLDVEAARRAVKTHVADPLGVDVDTAAIGILDVADAIMARGVRVVSVNRGHDPRDFYLLPFGGAGPMHALSVGALVDVGGVLIPPSPGTFSAVGLAGSDIKYTFARVVDAGVGDVPAEDVEALYQGMVETAAERFAGTGVKRVDHVRLARFRYAWQDNDVEVLIDAPELDAGALADAVKRFHEQHRFEFGHSNPEERVELVAVGLEAYGILDHGPGVPARTDEASGEPTRHREVYFKGPGRVRTPVYERGALAPGTVLRGPAIVEEREATTVVVPGTTLRVDDDLNLVITYDKPGEEA
ncbi:hydantoinase/oxoprolinase family protein [Nonomuraea ferruginea]|uniref:Hydantoinase/oxoprolinase family protein n=1 Tax=Nonomuraea ferruginea TaxID=46174 RepID=A0ABT4SW37_9ACTN|nr:hydantoinase/oxoprolinase family protein [Nonomuraea ferruginea]MDA0641476.1 hydantoinase/oxoprolinase family protein [Nonomuraea ferruginea]